MHTHMHTLKPGTGEKPAPGPPGAAGQAGPQ